MHEYVLRVNCKDLERLGRTFCTCSVHFLMLELGKKLGDFTMGGLRLISSGLSVDARVLDRNGQWHCEKVGTVKGNKRFKKANFK